MAIHLITGYKGSAHITSADQGAFNAALVGSGEYVLNSGNKFEAQILTNNSIRIKDGDICMQGRHISLQADTYQDVTIANGLQGMNRHDLIVARYKKDSNTGVESVELAVIQGVSTEGSASDPSYTHDDILAGGLLNEMPLYRVPLTGLNVGELVPLFTQVTETISGIGSELSTLDSEISAVAGRLGGLSIVKCTQTAYDAMASHDANTIYIIVG